MTTIQLLEHLLVQNVILPARASFISSKSWKKEVGEDRSPLTADFLLLCPLIETSNAISRELTLISNVDLVTSVIPLLFSVAIRSLPRVTPKQRSIEDSWLRHLFGKLEHCASELVSQSTPNLQSSQYISILDRMLRDALAHKVRLDDSTCGVIISRVLSRSDGEFNPPDNPHYWTLIGLCLEIDPDIFVTAHSIDKSSGGNRNVPNQNLASLLSRITGNNGQSTPYSDANYNAKLLKVALPLAGAFANSRDLTTFLFHWEEQLTICQQRRPEFTANSGLAKNIWEDERLISLVGRLIDSSLTISQIEQILQKKNTSITSPASVATEDLSKSFTDALIIDCVVNGLTKESTLSQLVATVHSLYLSILGIVLSASNWPAEQSWRLWRTLTALNERWPLLKTSINRCEAERLALNEALELVNLSLSTEATFVGQVYPRELHAFSFILSLASVQRIKPDTPQPEVDRTTSVIEAILNCWQSLYDSMSLGPIQHPVSTQFIGHLDKQSERFISVNILLVGYIAQIITFPSILR